MLTEEEMSALRWNVRTAFLEHSVLIMSNSNGLDAAVLKLLDQAIDLCATKIVPNSDVNGILRKMRAPYARALPREIVKVQMPLASNAAVPQALVYNEGRRRRQFITIADSLKALMGSDVLAYFYVKTENGKWVLEERAPDQDW